MRTTRKTKLAKLRISSGFSLQQMAEFCGVSVSTIHRWERRDRAPKTVIMALRTKKPTVEAQS